MIVVDPEEKGFEIVPLRQVASHWNVVLWLEQAPCTDCMNILGWSGTPDGTLLFEVQITNPFDNPNLTGFDVRGIPMFRGSYVFDASGLNTPDRTSGDGELVNADGHTTLYNLTTIGSGPEGLQGYIKGKGATAIAPNAVLNGYKRHITDDPANTRNAFYAGSSVIATYEIDMPDGQFIFGYGIDASWASATNKPVTDPMNDFPPKANCTEPWRIEISGDPISYAGSTDLVIDVYDWQGKATHLEPVLECPELFEGELTAAWYEDGDGYSRFEVTVANQKSAVEGEYRFLISAEDKMNAVSPDWLDLTGYQIVTLQVENALPTAVAEASKYNAWTDEVITFDGSGSFDNDCDGKEIVLWEWDWENDGVFDEANDFPVTDHAFYNEEIYIVDLRVTDDEGGTDDLDVPLVITVAGYNPFNLEDVTPGWLSFSAEDVCVDGNYVYVACGSYGLNIFELSDPSSPFPVGWVDTPGSANDVAVSSGYAYVADGSGGLQIVNVNPPETASIVGSVSTSVDAEGVAASSGHACIVGGLALDIIDVEPIGSAYVVNTVYMPQSAEGADVSGGYAYVANLSSGLQIIDIDPPETAHFEKTIDAMWHVHDVDVSDGYAYMTDGGYLMIIDVEPIESAEVVKYVDLGGMGWGDDVYVSSGYAYVAFSGWALKLIDIEPIENAYLVNTVNMLAEASDVAVSLGYAYVAAGDSGLQVIDIEPPEDASNVNFVGGLVNANDVAIGGGYVYIAVSDNDAPPDSGLQIIDISLPEAACNVSYVDTPGEAQGVAVSGGYAYLADSNEGLQIIDVDPPEDAYILNAVSTSGSARDVAVSGAYAYVASGTVLHIIDISSPGAEFIEGTVYTPDSAYGVAVSGEYAYVANNESGLQIVDIEPPGSAFIVKSVDTPGQAYGVDVEGGYAYVADDYDYLQIVDVEPVGDAYIVSSPWTSGDGMDVDVSGNYAYLVGNEPYSTSYLQIVDIEPPESAYELLAFNLWLSGEDVTGVAVSGDYVYVACDTYGLRIIRLWD